MPKTTHSIYTVRPRNSSYITDKNSALAYARHVSMEMLKEEFALAWDANTSREFGRFFDDNADRFWEAESPGWSAVDALGAKPNTKKYYQTKYLDVGVTAQEAFIKHKGWQQ